MPGKPRPDLVAEAIRLRIEERLGRNEIARRLGGQVVPTTVGRWLKSHPLADSETRTIRKRNHGGGRRKTRVQEFCVVCGEPRSRKANYYCGPCNETHGRRRLPTETYLVTGRLPTSRLKARLLSEGLLRRQCYECGLGPTWNEKPLKLQLDHIDGDRKNNLLENLRILCPNCHTQTETYAAKNRNNPNRSRRKSRYAHA